MQLAFFPLAILPAGLRDCNKENRLPLGLLNITEHIHLLTGSGTEIGMARGRRDYWFPCLQSQYWSRCTFQRYRSTGFILRAHHGHR
jgi:hypothetical protein